MRVHQDYPAVRPRRRARAAAPFVVVVAAALALAGCTGQAAEPAGVATESESAAIPQTPAGEAMRWVIDVFNSTEDPAAAEIEEMFADDFLELVPVPDFLAQTNAVIRPAAPFGVASYDEPDERTGVAIIEGTVGGQLQVQLILDDDGEIGSLLTSTAP